MPKLENGEDPLIVAALIDDDEDEESKAITKQFMDQAEPTDDHTDEAEEDDEDDDDDIDESNSPKPADKTEDDEEDEKPSGDKPPEAIDAKKDDDVEDDKPGDDEAEKKSRSERRAERKRQYLERLSQTPVEVENERRRQELLQNDYKPLDIQDGEYDADQLVQDRQRYAQSLALQATEQQRKFSEDQNFWTSVEYEAKLLTTNPDFAFLDEKSPDFDAKKTQNLNDLYLKVIGFETDLARDAKGLPVIDAQGQPVYMPSIRRRDLGFKEFAEGYLENMMDFDQDNEARITDNIVKQRAHQGVRPGGSSRRGLGRLKQGDISKMTADEVEANEAEIDRQINAELGIS